MLKTDLHKQSDGYFNNLEMSVERLWSKTKPRLI